MIIFNEEDKAKELLKSGKKLKSEELILLYRYFEKEYSSQAENMLLDYCKRNIEGFNEVSSYKWFSGICGRAKKCDLRENNAISLYDREINIINFIDDEDIRKIMFVMLCIGKYYKTNPSYKNRDEENKSNRLFLSTVSYKEVFKLAKVKYNQDKKNEVMYYMDSCMGLIDLKLNGSVEIPFAVLESDEEPVMQFAMWDDFIYEYEYYIGNDKIGKCEKCGIATKHSKTKKAKYCKDCAKIVDNLKRKERRNK